MGDKMKKLESENKALKKVTEDLKALVLKLEGRVEKLEKGGGGGGGATTNEPNQLPKMTTTMTSTSSAPTMRKRSPRTQRGSGRSAWPPTTQRSQRSPPSLPRPPCCSTASRGTTRPT